MFALLVSILTGGCQQAPGYGFGGSGGDVYASGVEQYPFDPVAVDGSNSAPNGISSADYTGTPAPLGGNSYTVQKGDTLWAIATRHYGDGQRWKDIHQANPSVEPNHMRVGQSIVLP